MKKSILEKGLDLVKAMQFHEKQALEFEYKAGYLENRLNAKDLNMTSRTRQVLESPYSGDSIERFEVRSKSLITFLRVEAQYHDQEAKRIEREFNRL